MVRNVVEEPLNSRKEISMMGAGVKVNFMEMGSLSRRRKEYIKETFRMVYFMEREFTPMRMEINMRDFLRII